MPKLTKAGMLFEYSTEKADKSLWGGLNQEGFISRAGLLMLHKMKGRDWSFSMGRIQLPDLQTATRGKQHFQVIMRQVEQFNP